MVAEVGVVWASDTAAEVLGVQGFPAMMDAEQFIVDHNEANVITQSFGAAEETFGTPQSLLNLRHAFISAAANGVTVLASSGDGGSSNAAKTPVNHPGTFPFPTVGWPASDPLVTGVGGAFPGHHPRPRPGRRHDRPAGGVPVAGQPGRA